MECKQGRETILREGENGVFQRSETLFLTVILRDRFILGTDCIKRHVLFRTKDNSCAISESIGTHI